MVANRGIAVIAQENTTSHSDAQHLLDVKTFLVLKTNSIVTSIVNILARNCSIALTTDASILKAKTEAFPGKTTWTDILKNGTEVKCHHLSGKTSTEVSVNENYVEFVFGVFSLDLCA